MYIYNFQGHKRRVKIRMVKISKNQKVNTNALKFYSDLKLNTGPFVLKKYKNYTPGRVSENTLVRVIQMNEVFEEKISWNSVGKKNKKNQPFHLAFP